jgi:hypothetical protein
MGAITRSIANNITTSGVFTSSAITNSSVTGITVLANAPEDSITFISSQTASNSASISFTSGLTSTYKAYKFVFVNCHPRTDAVDFEFNLSTDSGSNYNVTKTSSSFVAYHQENDTDAGLAYTTAMDLAQSTAYQNITDEAGNGADESVSGSLLLFNPASTTYVKHFISLVNNYYKLDAPNNHYIAGYCNTANICSNIFESANVFPSCADIARALY